MSDCSTLSSLSAQQLLPQSELPGIADFYARKSIFITGVTGFMGRCLLEKILRSLPNVDRIYLLVRPKKGKSIEERLEDIKNLKLFEKVLSDSPDMWDHIVLIAGDLSQPKLGISEEDEKILVEDVSIVFHLAATIQFNIGLRDAIQYNVVGVQEVVKLCHKMTKLESFIHVSSAYCNCHLKETDEAIYPTGINYKNVLSLLDWLSDDQLQLLTPSLIEGRPNTYTYSKSLGEQVILEEAADLPTAIIRPSIISAAYKEPLPGWIDCLHGPGGLFVACGKGLLRVIRVYKKGIADFVPVDFVNNMLLSIGWITALKKSPQPLVYHCNTGTRNPTTWIDLYPHVIKAYMDNPFDQIFRRPHLYQCRPPSTWKYWQFIFHYIPAYLVDFICTIIRKKPRMVMMYKKIEKALDQLDYFTQNSWKWSNENSIQLLSLMKPQDRQNFNFDVTTMDWKTYAERFCMGTKIYLMKDDPNNLKQARKQIKRLRNIRYTFNFIMFLLATRLLYIRSKIARELWTSFLGVCLKFLTKLGLPVLHYTM